MAELTNALQKYVIEQTRLGIPLLNHEEGLHGLQAPGATSYPQPIALAASFDPALVEEVMTAVAKETRARGAQHTLAPVVDVMRDARWGRAEETYGEDPYLVTRMGVAAVRGLQGPPRADRKIDSNHVMATLKHFAVHGQPESGINVSPGNLSERLIREVFFPPFVAAIKEAGARAVMPAYVEIDGVPAHANKQYLQDILRKEWGFDGLIVSDYFAVEQLKSLHSVVDSDAAAARLALESGVDLELPDPKMYPLLLAQVKSKAIPIALVDKSVARVLRAEVRPRPVRAAVHRRRAGGQDRGRRRTRGAGAQGGRAIDRPAEERGRAVAARQARRSRRSRSSAPTPSRAGWAATAAFRSAAWASCAASRRRPATRSR